MPSSSVRTFADPEQYERAVRGANLKELVTQRGAYKAQLTRIDLHRLWMQRGRKSLPAVSRTVLQGPRCAFVFLAHLDQKPMLNSGIVVEPGQIVSHAREADHYVRVQADYDCATMSLTPQDLASYAPALIGRELTAPSATRVVRPPVAAITRLMRLHEAACDLALNAPDILAHPEVARAMEQGLVRAMIHCLDDVSACPAVRVTRVPVMRRFEQALEAHAGQPLYLTELCAEIGVSDRALRRHCQEHLGMSPQRYLWLRRMNLVRRTLAHADRNRTTVTSIALEHGFGELGRFSVNYHKLFGEPPSATLHRARNERGSVHDRHAAALAGGFQFRF
jgi:AraC-like DNA-binding protein